MTKPLVIVALGASALTALSGSPQTIEAARAVNVTHASGAHLIASYHPAAILRADTERQATLRTALVGDLERAVSLLAPLR